MTIPAAEQNLDRAIGPWALGANAVNNVVGAGIFALPAVVAAILGPAAILAYLLCAALIVLVLACFAEVGTVVTRSGGAVAYIEEAFGSYTAWMAWIVFIVIYGPASDAAIAFVVLDSLGGLVPALAGAEVRTVLLVVLFGGLMVINVRGVRQGLAVSVATTIAKLLPLVFLMIVGAFALHPANLAWHGVPPTSTVGSAAMVLFFAFGGVETALTPSGEVRDPKRTVPQGVFGAVVAIVILYVGLQLVAQGVLGADLATQTQAPLAIVARRIMGGLGGTMVLAGAVIAGFGAIAADILCSPRALLPVVERGLLPRAFGTVHPRFRTPWIAIIAYGSVGLALALSGGFRALAVLASMALLLVYLSVCLAALRLRYTRVATPGAFRAPGGPTVAILGSLAVVWLLAHSSRTDFIQMGIVVAIATVVYGVRMQRIRLHPVTAGAPDP